MSTFHIASMMHLYDAIKMESYSDTLTTAAETGVIRFKNNGTKGGALYVSVQTGSETYEYRPMINKINGSGDIHVEPSQNDPGAVTISYTGTGGSGDVQLVHVTIPKGSDSVTVNGLCYADTGMETTNGFLYKVYKPNGESIAGVTVTTNGSDSSWVTINFGSQSTFTEIGTAVYVDLIIGTTPYTSVQAGTTEPTPRS